MQRSRFFITAFRLQRNPSFYKTVAMMRSLNKDQGVLIPPKEEGWISSNWSSLSVGNALMCLHYLNRGFTWSHNSTAARKIFDALLLEDSDQIMHALGSSLVEENSLTTYIEQKLPKYLKENPEDAKKGYWKPRDEGRVRHLTRNESLKTYQFEMIWNLIPVRDRIRRLDELANFPLMKTPDYILKGLFECIWCDADSSKEEDRYYGYGRSEMPIINEVIRRGMIKKIDVPVVIPSQPKPVTAKTPLVALVSKAEVKTIKTGAREIIRITI